MKHLFFLFCLAQTINVVFAQTAQPRYYYADSLHEAMQILPAEILEDEDAEHSPVAISVVTSKDVVRATFFDPPTQKLLAVMRGKITPYYAGGAQKGVMPDSSFTLKIPNKETIAFDASTNTMTMFAPTGEKQKTVVFRFDQQDTTVTETEYYKNGTIMSVASYHRLQSYNRILEYSSPSFPLTYEMMNGDRAMQEQTTTYFYPNGKKYAEQLYKVSLKKRYEPDVYWTVFDSTGAVLYKNVRYDDYYKQDKITLLDFYADGQIFKKIENKTVLPQYEITTYYAANTKKIRDYELNYTDSIKQEIAYITEKPDGFFRDKTKYGSIEKINMEANEHYIRYPLFDINKDSTHVDEINLKAQAASWQPDACPVKPPFVIEGAQDGVLPDGVWRIYFVDSLGKKTTLAVQAEFQKGVPNGKWFALDVAQDTLASATYKMGKITYNKYEMAYQKQENPEKYALDSVNLVQAAINKRNATTTKAQHELYYKQTKNITNTATNPATNPIFQRDTIVFPYNVGGINNYKNDLIIAIKERLSPDTNSIIRLKYYYPNHKNVPTSVIRYTQNTLEIDSIAVLYAADGKLTTRFDAKKLELADYQVHEYAVAVLQKNENEDIKTGNETNNTGFAIFQIPNDSTLITTKFRDAAGKILEYIHIDSVGFTPTMRKGAFWDEQRLKFKLKLPTELHTKQKTQVLAENEGCGFFGIECNDATGALICTQSQTYFDKNGKRYHTQIGGTLTQYDRDGTTITGVFGEDHTKWNGKMRMLGNENTDFMQYKNGKIEGEFSHFDTKDSTKTTYLYKNDILQSEKKWNTEGRLISDYTLAQTKPFAVTTRKYSEKGEIMVEEIFADSASAEKMPTQNLNTVEYLKIGKYYAIDTTGKRYLSGEIVREKDGRCAIRSWYASGKPQILRAYNDNVYALERLDFYDALRAQNAADFDFSGENRINFDDPLILHENGRLWLQGKSTNNLYCRYDDKGNIEEEGIENQDGGKMIYPKADEKETCHWEKLPYQTGKMQQGYRVGEWCGYYRNAKKQLQYRLHYDTEGFINGLFEEWDSAGQRTLIANYTKNELDGLLQVYSNNKLSQATLYKKGRVLEYKIFSEKGKLKQWETIRGDTTKTLVFNTKTGKISEKAIAFGEHEHISLTIDSVFNTKSKLTNAAFRFTNYEYRFEKITALDSTGTYRQAYAVNGETIAENQKAYFAAAEAYIATKKVCPIFENEKFANRDTFIARLNRFEHLKFSPVLKTNDFRTTPARDIKNDMGITQNDRSSEYLTYKTSDYDKHVLQPTAYTISDKHGQSFTLKPHKSKFLSIALAADSAATPAIYNLLAEEYHAATDCEMTNSEVEVESSFRYTLQKNKNLAFAVSSENGVSTVLRFPPAILRPANDNKNDPKINDSAAFVFNFNKFLVIKTNPHQYHDGRFIKQTSSRLNVVSSQYTTKNEQIKQINAIPVQAHEYILATQTPTVNQLYHIGASAFSFAPTTQSIINGTPLNLKNNSIFPYISQSVYLLFPHHQSFSKDSTVLHDAFLQQKKIRVFCEHGYIMFPPLVATPLLAENILIDNTEINLSFNFNTKNFTPEQLKKQCTAQGFDIIITDQNGLLPVRKYKKDEIYTAHLRYMDSR
jgi:antitoxin component YwqK of YwqJK toxin-antitoxin module